MQLVIFNGSPRRKKSNSKLLIKSFLEGYSMVSENKVPVLYIASSKDKETRPEAFKNAEIVLIIFPLYTDMMPGIVKEFFEEISKIKFLGNKKMGFIVQSGFPEAHHSIFLERYLEKFAKRLNTEYLGTIIKGGVEGIKIMPPWMTKKIFTNFRNLGENFAKNNKFDDKIKDKLRTPYKMSAFRRYVFKTLSKTGVTNFYWNRNLKKYNAFEKRFDKPYSI